MAKSGRRKRPIRLYKKKKAKKECWHPYSLQALSPGRFMTVTKHILDGKYKLLPFKDSIEEQESQSQRVQTVGMTESDLAPLEASCDRV